MLDSWALQVDCLVALKDECIYCKPVDNIWKNTAVLKVQLKNMVVLCPVRATSEGSWKNRMKRWCSKKNSEILTWFFHNTHFLWTSWRLLICTDFRFLSVLPELWAVPAEPLVLWAVWPAAAPTWWRRAHLILSPALPLAWQSRGFPRDHFDCCCSFGLSHLRMKYNYKRDINGHLNLFIS